MNSERRQTSRGDSGRALAQAAQAYVQAHSADKFSLQAVADALFDIAEAAKTGEMPAFMR